MPRKDKVARAEYGRGKYAKDRAGKIAYQQAYYQKNKAAILVYGRERGLRLRYGLSPESWTALFETQGRECAICKVDSARWHTDHDHVTGKVRGILCNACNMGIGLLKDDVAVLRAALTYLESAAAQ